MSEVCIEPVRFAVAVIVQCCLVAAAYYLGQWKAARKFARENFRKLMEEVDNAQP